MTTKGLESTPRHALGVLVLVFLVVAFSGKLHLVDYDGLVSSGRVSSLHYWLAVSLHWFPLALILLNLAMYLRGVWLVLKAAGFVACVIFVSPFVVYNVMDAFNKFAMIFWLSAEMGRLVLSRSDSGILSRVIVLSLVAPLHPFNFVLLVLCFPLAFALIVVFFVSFGGVFNIDGLAFVLGDKADLLSAYGTGLAETYGGNYKLVPGDAGFEVFGLSFSLSGLPRLIWFPAYMESAPKVADLLLAGFMGSCIALGIARFLFLGHYWVAFSLFVFSSVLATFVGNIAVMYRHLLPLMPAFFILGLAKRSR